MTILEAIERAKRIRAKQTRAHEDVGTQHVESGAPMRRAKIDVLPSHVPSLDYSRLNLIPEACEENRVLLTGDPGHPHARAADSYRILRTRLRHHIVADQLTSFGIVSVGADEGKSVTAINLALSFASERRRNVYLLDLDLRNPSLCRYLGISPTAEIGSCLAGAVRPGEVFFTVGLDNLAIAGGLTSYNNSSELLGGAALTELLDHIKQTDPYAMVVVDLPPLLQSADAMVVAPHLTAMLLVVAEGVTRRDYLVRASEVLAGMAVAGVVLNRSREAVEEYYG